MTHADFKRRFLPLQRILYREAYIMLGDSFEAEDAVQNLYMRLWEKRDELESLVAPEAYLRAMLKNICIDRLRVLRTRCDECGEPVEDVPVYTPPDIETREAEQGIELFLSALPPEHQKVMRMRMNGCSFQEIEDVTGLSAVNVRVILSRIRKRFKELYNKE